MKLLKLLITICMSINLLTPAFVGAVTYSNGDIETYDTRGALLSSKSASSDITAFYNNGRAINQVRNAGAANSEELMVYHYGSDGQLQSIYNKDTQFGEIGTTIFENGRAIMVINNGVDADHLSTDMNSERNTFITKYHSILDGTHAQLNANNTTDAQIKSMTIYSDTWNQMSDVGKQRSLGQLYGDNGGAANAMTKINTAMSGKNSDITFSYHSNDKTHILTAGAKDSKEGPIVVKTRGIKCDAISSTNDTDHAWGTSDPLVQGTLSNVVQKDGKYYAAISANSVDVYDGKGAQKADGEVIYVEISALDATNLQGSVGKQAIFAGDVTADVDGHLTMTLNEGGYKVGDTAAGVTSSWMSENKGFYNDMTNKMSSVWASAEQSGSNSDWKAGWNFLKGL